METIYTKAVGVSRKGRQRIIEEELYDGADISVEREPENPVDVNAIALFAGLSSDKNMQIGYVSADLASRLAPMMDAGYLIVGAVEQVTGADKGTLGVNIRLDIFTPDEAEETRSILRSKGVLPPFPVAEQKATPPSPTSSTDKPTSKQTANPKRSLSAKTFILIIFILFMGCATVFNYFYSQTDDGKEWKKHQAETSEARHLTSTAIKDMFKINTPAPPAKK